MIKFLTIFLLLCSPVQAAVSNAGLVAYWPLDENAGTKAQDYSGRNNTATLVASPTWSAGHNAYALNFNGTTQYLTVPNSSVLQFGTGSVDKPFSMTYWVKTTGNSIAVAQKGHIGNRSFQVYIEGSGLPGLWVIQDSTHIIGRTGTIACNNNRWHHVVVTYDGTATNNGIAVYLDGGAQSTTSSNVGTYTAMANDGEALTIGCQFQNVGSTPLSFMSGLLDDVRIYNRVLSATEVAALFRRGQTHSVSVSNAGLQVYYPFDENTGTKTKDYSGNGNDGTLTNTPTWSNGKLNKALTFVAASTQSVSFTYNTSIINTANALTYSAWIKTNQSTGSEETIMQIGGNFNKWSLYIDGADAGKPSLSCTGNFVGRTIAKTNVKDNRWHHVVGTLSGTTTKIYVDGNLETSGTQTLLSQTGSQASAVGINAGGGDAFNGSMDDVRIYARALTAAEVTTLFRMGETHLVSVSNAGLAGYWTLDENAGTKAQDYSGKGNAGTLTNGPTWTKGRNGNAISFDGSNDFITMGDPADGSLDFGTGDFSVAYWINVNGTLNVSNEYGVIGKNSTFQGVPGWQSELSTYGCATATFGIISLITNQATFGTTTVSTAVCMDKNRWYHYVYTRVGTTENAYINGALVGTKTTAENANTVSNANSLIVGDNSWSPNMPAIVDDIRLYNRALSATEIATLYKRGTQVFK